MYHWIVDYSRQFRGGSLVWIESGRNTVSRVFASVLDSADNTSRLHNRSVNQRRDWPLPTSYPPRRQPVKSTRLETPGQGKIVKLHSDNSPPTCINCRINYRSSTKDEARFEYSSKRLKSIGKIRLYIPSSFRVEKREKYLFSSSFSNFRERLISSNFLILPLQLFIAG